MALVEGAAVVTGGSRGIGAAVARELARGGAGVVVCYRAAADRADDVVAAIRADGGRAVAVQADVTVPGDVDRLAEVARAEIGSVSIVVSNASPPNDRKPFLELTWDDVQVHVEGTLRAFFLLAQAFLPDMIERGAGRLIGLGSTQALHPLPGAYAYVTGKSGLEGLVRALAKEVGEHGVTVNLVTPGFTATDRVGRVSDQFRAAYAKSTPRRRLGEPDDVASAVRFLASAEATYVTGTSILVDGGHVLA
jgi:3-oxoacyl-[acyl-carrier protein] reductase